MLSDGQLITRKFIVLRDLGTNTIVSFTDWNLYVKSGKNRLSHNISEDGNKRHNYVVMLLNYAFFDKYHIEKLTDINIEIVSDFLNDYGRGTLPGNKSTRSESTVNKCIVAIIDFLDLLATKNRCSFKKADLYKEVEYRTKKGRMAKRKVPVFDVFFIENKIEILRDMPEKVFSILMSHIRDNNPSILMLAALSAFGGLRPSESCNVRRKDSALGAGIRFTIEDDEVTQIRIDLLKELNLRSDCIKVGCIKKERTQDIYPAFRKLFYQFYQSYMDYMDSKNYEADYGPLSVNSKGMAMIIKEKLITSMSDTSDKLITDGEYNKLSVHNQTRLIKELDMTPTEIETTVRKATASFKKSAEIINKLYTSSDRDSIIKALHRIGNGEAVSKQNECECLYTAFRKVCPYDENHNCIGCDYEISTKSTMFLMVSEYNRLMDLYKNSESLNEKEKNEYMLKRIVLPAMDEMITCVAENYGYPERLLEI